VNWAGPDLGRHTDEVLRDVLTLSPERISELHDTGVVA
jgi:crotonobetainyl-CoA:carnitine CoA-transferase CaiB-like acyl-CoA transferase